MSLMHRCLQIAYRTSGGSALLRAPANCRLPARLGIPSPSVESRQLAASNRFYSAPSQNLSASSIAKQVSNRVVSRPYSTNTGKSEATIEVETKTLSSGNNVATITVSNPRKLNIVNSDVLNKLIAGCDDLSNDPDLRVVVITGGPTAEGKPATFIGGADISEMHALTSADRARDFITRVHVSNKALRNLPVPVIARIDGLCLGAGLELVASCDLRVATKTSTFGMPELKVGIPCVIEAALLPSLIGMGRTRRLFYLAEIISAAEADKWGLVEEVVEDTAALDKTVDEWVEKIASMGPRAVRGQKPLMKSWENTSVDEGIKASIESYVLAYADGGKEPQEFMAKFLNRKR